MRHEQESLTTTTKKKIPAKIVGNKFNATFTTKFLMIAESGKE